MRPDSELGAIDPRPSTDDLGEVIVVAGTGSAAEPGDDLPVDDGHVGFVRVDRRDDGPPFDQRLHEAGEDTIGTIWRGGN